MEDYIDDFYEDSLAENEPNFDVEGNMQWLERVNFGGDFE